MLTLIQFPWSPFCITVRHILEQDGIPFRLRNIPSHERAPIIRATNGRGDTVSCMVDGERTICDVTDFGQEVARYIDRGFNLDLFPKEFEGIQLILSRHIENDLEMVGFKVNDGYPIPSRPWWNESCWFDTRSANSERAASRNGPAIASTSPLNSPSY